MSALAEAAQHSNTPVASPELVALLGALTALRDGNTRVRLPAEWTGVPGKVADVFNEIAELNERMSGELGRLSQSVGKEGRLTQRGSLVEARDAGASRSTR